MCLAGTVVACWSLKQEVAGRLSEKHLGKTPSRFSLVLPTSIHTLQEHQQILTNVTISKDSDTISISVILAVYETFICKKLYYHPHDSVLFSDI